MEEQITLVTPGSLPGIPGYHAPGTYLVDYTERTLRTLENAPIDELAQAEMPGDAPMSSSEPAQETVVASPIEQAQEPVAALSVEQLAEQVAQMEAQLKTFEPGA